VDSGVTVTLSQPLCTEARIDVPEPADHHMTMLTDVDIGSGSVRFAKDYVGVDYHNDGHTHIDAFCHVAFDGSFFDGKSDRPVTGGAAQPGAIDILKDGLVGRGVLLDVPRVRGVPWLEPWDAGKEKAGLHPTTASFLADREVAALGSDGNSDTAPSTTEGIGFPIHVLAINAMGIHMLDYLQFEDLVRHCEAEGRWEFLFVVAPLRVVGGTGSPVNPIAMF
jgi:hypothetical protein